MEQADQSLVFRASMLEKQSQETAQQIDLLEREIYDLDSLHKNLDSLSGKQEKMAISSIGKGVYIRSHINEDTLLVSVGAGVIVKKTIEDTKKTIEDQINKLAGARAYMLENLELYNKNLHDLIHMIEDQRKTIG